MLSSGTRTRLGAGLGVVAIAAGTAAGAATLHRFAVTSTTGSGSATTYLQSSATGSALQGEVAGSANTGIKIPFGVLGEYDATGTTFGSGVLGVATTGYGVGAESLSKTQPSLLALNSSGGPAAEIYGEQGGDGLDVAATGGGTGISVSGDSTDAIFASTTSGYFAIDGENETTNGFGGGVNGFSFATGGVGVGGSVSGQFGSAVAGYSGASPGVGVFADAEDAMQGFPALQAYTGTDGTELFDAGVSDNNTQGLFSISTVLSSVSQNNSGTVFTSGVASSDLQINGDIYLTGALYTQCGDTVPYAMAACGDETKAAIRSKTGSKYGMYESAHASETVEDEGEAVLRGGSAHVALDPAFASVISTREPYLVFTTPQGDTRGLYVTNRTPSGFDVRETQGGHGSLTFDYRIVAHPYGESDSRMALITAKARTHAGASPANARALAAHMAAIAHMHAAEAHHRPFHMRKAPPDLVSPASFTTR